MTATGIRHPQDVVCGARSEVLHAGGEHGEIYSDARRQVASGGDTGGGPVLGLALDAGMLVACDEGSVGCCASIPVRGEVIELTSGTADRPMILPSHPAFLDAETLLVSDSGHWVPTTA